MMELSGKRILVVGLARSGMAVARFAKARGAIVSANDMKPAAQLDQETNELRQIGLEPLLGSHPETLFTSQDTVVLSPGVPSDIAALNAARAAGAEVISEAEFASRFLKGKMIGITGSNGKTTTTVLVGELMKAAGAKVLVGGNIGVPLTSLADQSDDNTWTVAELSSFQLENVKQLRVNVAVVTNITPDHLDRHPTFEDYVRAKQNIFLNQAESDWAVLNAGDRVVVAMGGAEAANPAGLASSPRRSGTVYFSSSRRTAIEHPSVFLRDDKIVSTIAEDRSEIELISRLDIPLPGMHNVENVMAALAATLCALGANSVDLERLRETIKTFKGVEHRIEFVETINGVKYYNDSKATNVDSTVKSLEAFSGNIILILGGKDKGSDYTQLAHLVSERVKQIVLIGAASDKIASQLYGIKPIVRAGSMADAIAQSTRAAVSGDIVLLAPACASFDMFDNYEHRGRVFKDEVRKLARISKTAAGEVLGQ